MSRGDRLAFRSQERQLSLIRDQPLGDVAQVVLPPPTDEFVGSHDARHPGRVDSPVDMAGTGEE
jgi:hypothetical protein